MPDILEEIKRLREQGRDVSNDDLILMQLIKMQHEAADLRLAIAEQNRSQNVRLAAIEAQIAKQAEYPSLTWLMRYRTRDTVMVIVALFVILSLWYVSGFREPLMQWLGLPSF